MSERSSAAEQGLWKDDDRLRRMYKKEGLTQYEIADRLGCSQRTVKNWMDKFGIESRSYGKGMSLRERFNQKIGVKDNAGCWEWTGAKDSEGYGHIKVEGAVEQAHRIAYRLHTGEIGGHLVLHNCGNKSCVNPDHLYLGDKGDNLSDQYELGERERPRGESSPVAKLSEEYVITIRSRIDDGETHAEIARDFGLAPSTVSMISSGENWGWLEE